LKVQRSLVWTIIANSPDVPFNIKEAAPNDHCRVVLARLSHTVEYHSNENRES
jgi:hypothetical protein